MRTPQELERGLAAPETLGLETRVEIRLAAEQLLEEMPEGSGRLVIDLTHTREVDSAGLGALMLIQRLRRRAAPAGGAPQSERGDPLPPRRSPSCTTCSSSSRTMTERAPRRVTGRVCYGRAPRNRLVYPAGSPSLFSGADRHRVAGYVA